MSAPRVLVAGAVLAQPMGGVRRHNRELLPRAAALLEKDGGSLAVLEGAEPIAFELPGIERLSSRIPLGPALARAAIESPALRLALETARVQGRAFDLVHTAHLPAPRALPVPFTLTLHDLKSLEPALAKLPRRLLGRRLLADALARAELAIAVSETLARELRDGFELAPERLRIVPNAADHMPVLPRALSLDAPLVHVGHIEPRKNVELVVRALALDRELPSLVLAGEERGGEGARLARIARELGVEARVRFAGLLDDAELAQLYARAACVVLPSLREGFGIPALEAQRAGAPLAISRSPALLEVAGAETPSFDAHDPTECVRAIRAAMIQSSRALASAAERANRFTWQRSAELLVHAWRSATERAR